MGAKASYLKHMLTSLAESEGDEVGDNERKHAKNFLKMLDEAPPAKDPAKNAEEKGPEPKKEPKAEGDKDEPKKEEPEGKKAAAAEKEDPEKEPKKAAKADADGDDDKKEPKKAAAKEEKEMKAAAMHASTLDLAARLHKLEAEKAAKEDADARAGLLARRPDFSPEIRATLAKASIDQLTEAVEKWPRIAGKAFAPAAASSAMGVRGSGEGSGASYSPPEETDFIARKMGASVAGTGIKNTGRDLELGFMTAAEAAAFLATKQPQTHANGGK